MLTIGRCLFCLIIQGKIPSYKVYETEHSYAFLDINPVSEGHTLVIPKHHTVKLGELPDEYLSDIGPAIKKVALATGAEDYNVLQNNGKLAFQHVDHVHFHVIPKPNAKEGLVLNVEDNWPQKKVGPDELKDTLEDMQERLP
ncbi:HIT-like protein [Auriscalpium vulgare]|uniref:HIT-like protein n=1 Tax=Auriscalpium vulgare TaxID=40419 RepID=A0ACB8S2A4_9AGAM|nr:HIT-like protein [Auriscalpium vulgare]